MISCADVQEGATEGSGKATPSGVFDCLESGSPGLGASPTSVQHIPKGISPYIACLFYQKPGKII